MHRLFKQIFSVFNNNIFIAHMKATSFENMGFPRWAPSDTGIPSKLHHV